MPIQDSRARQRAVDNAAELLRQFDVLIKSDKHMGGTPARFVKYLEEFFQGDSKTKDVLTGWELDVDDPSDHATSVNSLVLQTNIPFIGCCAHHLLPMLGVAHVAYIPKLRLVGLSKLTRLVETVTHEKPSLQEHMCERIVQVMDEQLAPLGAACVVQSEHCCMAARGVRATKVLTTTSRLRGVFFTNADARRELFQLIQLAQRNG